MDTYGTICAQGTYCCSSFIIQGLTGHSPSKCTNVESFSGARVHPGKIHLYVGKKTIDFPAVWMVGMCSASAAECNWDFCLSSPPSICLSVFCAFSLYPLCADLHLSGWMLLTSIDPAYHPVHCYLLLVDCEVWIVEIPSCALLKYEILFSQHDTKRFQVRRLQYQQHPALELLFFWV